VIATVAARNVGDRYRSVLGYGIGLGLMIVWVMAIYPSVQGELGAYVDAMPDAMKSMFRIEDVTSLAGFVQAEIMSFMGPLVFIALAITSGASTIAGEERERILPIVLATGIGRGRLVAAKLAAVAVQLGAVGVCTLIALMIGTMAAGGGITVARLTAGAVQLTALGLLFGALAVAVGAATGRKSVAAGVATGVALGSYLIDALAGMAGWLEPLQVVSPFHWHAPNNPLVAGLSVGWLALLLATTAVLAVVAVVTFDRRDVGV